MPFTPEEKRFLLETARLSIESGFSQGRPRIPDEATTPAKLLQPGASFVTLNLNGRLRGCIGTTEAYQPLARDVAEHAFAAAFQDPRFPPLTPEEWPETSLEISVLTPAEPMNVQSREDLLEQLQPGKDGLILQSGRHKATFLPSVWEQLPDKEQFVAHLMQKAGLPPYHWPADMRAYRYGSISIA